MYQNVDQFLQLKKQEVKSSQHTSSAENQSKFHLHSARLVCPIHDDMQFRYFCRQDQEFVCDYCMFEKRHHNHELEDLELKCQELRSQFHKQLSQTQSSLNQVKVKKSMIQSGKHIDAFFDSLIQNILQLHTSIKEKYRQNLEEGHSTFQSAGEAQSPYRFNRTSTASTDMASEDNIQQKY